MSFEEGRDDDGEVSVEEKPRRRARGLRTDNESDSAFTPSVIHPAWEKWSLPVARAIQRGEDTVDKISNSNSNCADMPGFRLRNCLAWLEMAGVVFYARGAWRLAPYGVKWLSMNSKKED